MTPQTLDKLRNLLVTEEAYRRFPYLDTKGNITIGIGNNLSAKGITSIDEANKLYPDGITFAKAKEDLSANIKDLIKDLSEHLSFFQNLDEVRQAVLIDMAYNMGIEKLLVFKITLGLIELGKYEQASREMLLSLWAVEVKTRARRLSLMMETGVWPKLGA